jgi:hypothetical protein
VAERGEQPADPRRMSAAFQDDAEGAARPRNAA